MAKPRPRAVVRLSAKTDTLVSSVITLSTVNVPTIEMAPITSGSAAATRPRKMNSSRSSVMGSAIISATWRSCSVVVPTWRNTSAIPPTRTDRPSNDRA